MVKRVKDGGKSEGLAVMAGIGVRTLPHCESKPTSTGCSSRQTTAAILARLDEHCPGFCKETIIVRWFCVPALRIRQ